MVGKGGDAEFGGHAFPRFAQRIDDSDQFDAGDRTEQTRVDASQMTGANHGQA